MRKTWFFPFFCIVVILVIVTWNYAKTHQANGGPRMALSERVFDFGEVSSWVLLEHTFSVSNQGNTVLHIDRVSPD